MDIESNKELKQLLLEMAEVADFLWKRGWAERNAGNISISVDHCIKKPLQNLEAYPSFELDRAYPKLATKHFLVTGTGKRMRDLARNPLENARIIRLNNKGDAYWIISQQEIIDNFQPTSELPTHLGIHQMIKERGSQEKVVMHAHVSELIALTQSAEHCDEDTLNKLIWGMHPETMIFIPKGIGFIPFVMPGTEEIARKTIQSLADHDMVLWEKHGIFAIGSSVYDTFDAIDIVSKSVKIWFMCRSAGIQPQGLSEEKLASLRDLSSRF